MAKKQQNQLPPNEIVEVEMIKKMPYSEYMAMYQKAKTKGWRIQAYEIGFRSNLVCKKCKNIVF